MLSYNFYDKILGYNAITSALRNTNKISNSIKRRIVSNRPSLVFGVGMPKTGTTSIAKMLGPSQHGYHEKNRARIIPLIRSYCNGRAGVSELKLSFAIRDICLYPLFDVAHYYGAIVGELSDLFPESKFIVTLRNCYSWAESFGNQLIKRWRWKEGWSKDCGDYLVKWQKYQLDSPRIWKYPSEELKLKRVGMPPLATLYEYYRRRNTKLLGEIPPDRRIIIKTSEIDQSISQLEQFAGLPGGTLNEDRSHARKRQQTFVNLFEDVPSTHLKNLAQKYCNDIMKDHFSEINKPMDVQA